MIHSGLAYCLKANSYEAYCKLAELAAQTKVEKNNIEEEEEAVEDNFDNELLEYRMDKALDLHRKLYRFYKYYNDNCGTFNLIFMTDNMFLSWTNLYGLVAYFNQLGPLALLLLIVNTLSPLANILCHAHQASLEVRTKEFLQKWSAAITNHLNSNDKEKGKLYRREIRSHAPVYYSYAGLCRMEPSTVLELIYHFTNHITVFLRL